MKLLCICVFVLLFSDVKVSSSLSDCKRVNEGEYSSKLVDVFWINLRSSTQRKLFMENQLKFYGLPSSNRVVAATPKDIIIPPRLHLPQVCLQLKEKTVDLFRKDQNLTNILIDLPQSIIEPTSQAAIDALNPEFDPGKFNITIPHPERAEREYIALITDHCGRPKNSRRELTVTVSHLKALKAATSGLNSEFASHIGLSKSTEHVAVHPKRQNQFVDGSEKPYALILEDDTQVPFQLDLDELVKQAPPDFAMIQFLTTNEKYMQMHWKKYTATGELWTPRLEQDLWCASAYLINKERIRTTVNDIVSYIGHHRVYRHRIVAGYAKPCFPEACCKPNEYNFVPKKHCVFAPRGYQADHYIFSLAIGHTYASNVPLVTGGRVGNRSTVHQDHVFSHHISAFKRANGYLNELEIGDVKPPTFINVKCKFKDE